MAESLTVSGLRERPLRSVTCRLTSDSATGSRGSGRELPLSKFIAVKLPLEFRFPEADLHH
jgi:hypothetical protein